MYKKVPSIALISLLIFGCKGVGFLPVGSKDHKATIVYFEGGNGRVIPWHDRAADNTLINRSMTYFLKSGIKIVCQEFYIPDNEKFRIRTSKKHFIEIQEIVYDLRKNGHDHIWLMGISNGSISVMHAGACQIDGVEGIVALNPARDTYLPHRRNGNFIDFRQIKLPFLLVTHQYDNCYYKGFSKQFFENLFSSSQNPELVVLSGGDVGTGAEATHLTQKYQHGFSGIEEAFANTVIDFVYKNRK